MSRSWTAGTCRSHNSIQLQGITASNFSQPLMPQIQTAVPSASARKATSHPYGALVIIGIRVIVVITVRVVRMITLALDQSCTCSSGEPDVKLSISSSNRFRQETQCDIPALHTLDISFHFLFHHPKMTAIKPHMQSFQGKFSSGSGEAPLHLQDKDH